MEFKDFENLHKLIILNSNISLAVHFKNKKQNANFLHKSGRDVSSPIEGIPSIWDLPGTLFFIFLNIARGNFFTLKCSSF